MIVAATLPELYFLALNMRRRDRQELAETREDLDPSNIAWDAYNSPWAFVARGRDKLPVMAIGATPDDERDCRYERADVAHVRAGSTPQSIPFLSR